MMSMGSTRLWVLVTDGHRARIVVPSASEGQFHTQLILGVAQYPYCPPPLRSGLRSVPHGQFTADVAHRIDEAAEHDAFDRLIVMVPHAVADEIRRALHPTTRARLAMMLDQDCVTLDDTALSARLARWWPAHDEVAEAGADVPRAAATA